MQLELMHESFTDALGFIVQALGGPKKVGVAMRPDLPADHAATWVRDCLNAHRRERFTPDQVLWLLREARRAGVHAGMAFIARDCGYADPVPLEPEDERAQLQRDFAESVRLQAKLVERMERLGSASLRSVA